MTKNSYELLRLLHLKNFESEVWWPKIKDVTYDAEPTGRSGSVMVTATRVADGAEISVYALVENDKHGRGVHWNFDGKTQRLFPSDFLKEEAFDLYTVHWRPFHGRGWLKRVAKQVSIYLRFLAGSGGDTLYAHLHQRRDEAERQLEQLREDWVEIAGKFGAVSHVDALGVYVGHANAEEALARAFVSSRRLQVRYRLDAYNEVKPLRLRLIADLAEAANRFNPNVQVAR